MLGHFQEKNALKEFLCFLGKRKETCLNIISHLLPFKDFSTTFLKILSEKTEFATHWQFSDCFFWAGKSL